MGVRAANLDLTGRFEEIQRVAAMFLDPVGSLKRLAPAYKQVESQLDSAFWRSKYVAR